MPKLAVMLGIEPVQNARAYSTLPLHCTLLQWVVVDEAEKYTLLGNLRRIITTIGNSMSFSTIDLFATHEEMFGVNADVPSMSSNRVWNYSRFIDLYSTAHERIMPTRKDRNGQGRDIAHT